VFDTAYVFVAKIVRCTLQQPNKVSVADDRCLLTFSLSEALALEYRRGK